MSLSRRIYNLARAELKSAVDRLLGPEHDPDIARFDEELRAAEADRAAPPVRERSAEIDRAYANLELPLGAPAAEVRAAYRRLMRRYHPDRHHGDDEKARVANELAQRLKSAHDLLIGHLEG